MTFEGLDYNKLAYSLHNSNTSINAC